MNIFLKLIINALVILLVAHIVPGIFVTSFLSAIVVAIVMAIINVTLKPALIILTLPINILTLGLFTFVINALMLMLTSFVVKGFEVDGFLPALLASLLISLFHVILRRLETRRS